MGHDFDFPCWVEAKYHVVCVLYVQGRVYFARIIMHAYTVCMKLSCIYILTNTFFFYANQTQPQVQLVRYQTNIYQGSVTLLSCCAALRSSDVLDPEFRMHENRHKAYRVPQHNPNFVRIKKRSDTMNLQHLTSWLPTASLQVDILPIYHRAPEIGKEQLVTQRSLYRSRTWRLSPIPRRVVITHLPQGV